MRSLLLILNESQCLPQSNELIRINNSASFQNYDTDVAIVQQDEPILRF